MSIIKKLLGSNYQIKPMLSTGYINNYNLKQTKNKMWNLCNVYVIERV